MPDWKNTPMELVQRYDQEAEAMGWHAPEVVFGLMYGRAEPGQTLLDLGTGTGLGSGLFRKAGLAVHGLDISEEMIAACQAKGFDNLIQHDLGQAPYPFADQSMDHAVCIGVMHFFPDPGIFFSEAGRILRPQGLFGFVVRHRSLDQKQAITVSKEHTGTDRSVTMYRHATEEIETLLSGNGFSLLSSLAFTIYMDRERKQPMAVKAYVARKT